MQANPALAVLLESSRHALCLVIHGLDIYIKSLADPERKALLTFRQAAIMMLGALEDYMEVSRSIVPQRKKGKVK